MTSFAIYATNALFGFFTMEIAGNTIARYLIVLLAFALTLLLVKFFKFILVRKIKGLVARAKNAFADLLVEIVEKIGLPFYLVLATYVALQFVKLPEPWPLYLHYLLIITLTFYIVRALQKILGFALRKSMARDASQGVTRLFETMINIFLWAIAILLILQNLGYKIDTLIAGLGIASIAIAFAVQKILEDIFSAFSIYFDRSFEVGDFIVVGTDMGTVKDIGLKSTRLVTLEGDELIIPNREITNTRVRNYRRLKRRGVIFSFNVSYETPVEKLEKIPDIVKRIFSKIELAELNRVHLKSLGDFGITYEVFYYVGVPDYVKYLDIRQQINLALIKEFEKEGIKLAYPLAFYQGLLKKA